MTKRKARRRKPEWPPAAVPLAGKVLCVDPGPTAFGWAVLEFRPGSVPVCLGGGHDEIRDVLALLRTLKGDLALVAAEGLLPYSRAGVPSGSKALMGTAFAMGRLAQEAARAKVPYADLPRRDVIRELTGCFPAPGRPVSKAQMQEVVRDLLGLSEPIRPQHANDAACAGLAIVRRLEAEAEEGSVA